MAIDTAAKRRSAAQAGDELTTGGMPLPTGTIDAVARATMQWLYSGITIAAPAVDTGGGRGKNYGRGGGWGRWSRRGGYQR